MWGRLIKFAKQVVDRNKKIPWHQVQDRPNTSKYKRPVSMCQGFSCHLFLMTDVGRISQRCPFTFFEIGADFPATDASSRSFDLASALPESERRECVGVRSVASWYVCGFPWSYLRLRQVLNFCGTLHICKEPFGVIWRLNSIL